VRQPEMNPDIFLPVSCAFAIIGAFITAPGHDPRVRDLAPLEYAPMDPKPERIPHNTVLSYDGAVKPCGKTYCWTPERPIDRLIESH
jgi:hypothetical protein